MYPDEKLHSAKTLVLIFLGDTIMTNFHRIRQIFGIPRDETYRFPASIVMKPHELMSDIWSYTNKSNFFQSSAQQETISGYFEYESTRRL